MKKNVYQNPEVEVVELAVERGFDASNGSDTKPGFEGNAPDSDDSEFGF